MQETKFIVMHETWWASWLKDIGSLGTLAGLIYVNHQYGGGSAVVDGVGALMLLVFLLTRAKFASGSAHSFTKDDLRRWALKQETK